MHSSVKMTYNKQGGFSLGQVSGVEMMGHLFLGFLQQSSKAAVMIAEPCWTLGEKEMSAEGCSSLRGPGRCGFLSHSLSRQKTPQTLGPSLHLGSEF